MSFTKLRADPRATEWETLHQPNVPSQKDRGGREWWFLNSHPNKLNQVIKVQVFVIVSVYSRSWRRQATWLHEDPGVMILTDRYFFKMESSFIFRQT